MICTLQVFAQREGDKTIDFNENISDFFFHEISGVPMVSTSKAVNGIDPVTGEVIWSLKANSFKGALNALGQDVEIYKSVPLTPFGIVAQTLIDTRNGNILLSKDTHGYTRIVDNKIVLETGDVLVSTKNKETKQESFHLVDVLNSKVKWSKEIPVGNGKIKNVINIKDRLIFSVNKNLVILDASSGDIVLNEKENIGNFFIDDVAGNLIAVEAKSTGLIGKALKAGFSPFSDEPLGKKIIAYNIATGAKVWKKDIKLSEGYQWSSTLDGKLLVKHEKGANIYDYTTGLAQWKKDYGKKSIKNVEKTAEGYMVYYGSKRILVDNSGKKIWKKPERVRKDIEYDVNDDEEDVADIEYSKGFVVITGTRIIY